MPPLAFHLWPLKPLDSALMFGCVLPLPPPPLLLPPQLFGYCPSHQALKFPNSLPSTFLLGALRPLQASSEPHSSKKPACGSLDTQCCRLSEQICSLLGRGGGQGAYYFSLPTVRCVYFFKGCPLPTPIFEVAMFGGRCPYPWVCAFIEIV